MACSADPVATRVRNADPAVGRCGLLLMATIAAADTRWRNGGGPTIGGRGRVPCRRRRSAAVVMVDIRNVDLTGHDLPWDAAGQLSMLEELSLWNCGLGELNGI